ALTCTVLAPNGHLRLEPGPVPQPPVQFKVVSWQPFGSLNPSSPPFTSAPPGELPLMVTDALPLKAGTACASDAAASARPYPNVLFGSPDPSRTALFPSSPRSLPRASSLPSAPALPLSRHGAACSASAAMPATCGAAADVPKKG